MWIFFTHLVDPYPNQKTWFSYHWFIRPSPGISTILNYSKPYLKGLGQVIFNYFALQYAYCKFVNIETSTANLVKTPFIDGIVVRLTNIDNSRALCVTISQNKTKTFFSFRPTLLLSSFCFSFLFLAFCFTLILRSMLSSYGKCWKSPK